MDLEGKYGLSKGHYASEDQTGAGLMGPSRTSDTEFRKRQPSPYKPTAGIAAHGLMDVTEVSIGLNVHMNPTRMFPKLYFLQNTLISHNN